MPEHIDVVIVGAGLSGIAQAHHLQTRCPDRRYVILEARNAIGGTWDLFRYPGIRSDSDMHTLGFGFRPWRGAKAIADGAAIREYIRDAAREGGIDRQIRFGSRVRAASWSKPDARWTVEADTPAGRMTLTCDFLCLCSGYYDYTQGHAPDFPGASSFAGRIVHPQAWPDGLAVAGQRVVVIGSGATAVTLVPELARTAAHVTMLQRSPSYVVSRPSRDRVADALMRVLPARWAYRATRWKNVVLGIALFRLARARPARIKARIVAMVQKELGAHYDVAAHFTPGYDPWDQRVCLVPDADLFRAIRSGRVEVVTDHIDRFVTDGIRLASGRTLGADLVVTATGLKIQVAGGMVVSVDGEPVSFAGRLAYKGMMFDQVPNLSLAFGYTNASWTLKAELTATYVCRLLNTMRSRGLRQATPVNDDPTMVAEPFLDFSSGYVQRARDIMPAQGSRAPWKVHQNYLRDLMTMRFGSVDSAMRFSNPVPGRSA